MNNANRVIQVKFYVAVSSNVILNATLFYTRVEEE